MHKYFFVLYFLTGLKKRAEWRQNNIWVKVNTFITYYYCNWTSCTSSAGFGVKVNKLLCVSSARNSCQTHMVIRTDKVHIVTNVSGSYVEVKIKPLVSCVLFACVWMLYKREQLQLISSRQQVVTVVYR